MRLLNLGCGNTRPGEPWTNVDNLYAVLPIGSPERANLNAEPNYENADISMPLPFCSETFDGILLSHVIEHFDCMASVRLLVECRRILKPFGVLIVSVPDASYFRSVRDEDTLENAERLFGEKINLEDGEKDFMGYALFFREHKQVLSEDSLWCILTRAGFSVLSSLVFPQMAKANDLPVKEMLPLLNRRKFSLEMIGVKNDS